MVGARLHPGLIQLFGHGLNQVVCRFAANLGEEASHLVFLIGHVARAPLETDDQRPCRQVLRVPVQHPRQRSTVDAEIFGAQLVSRHFFQCGKQRILVIEGVDLTGAGFTDRPERGRSAGDHPEDIVRADVPRGYGGSSVLVPAVGALFAQGVGAGSLDASVRQDDLLVRERIVRELGNRLAHHARADTFGDGQRVGRNGGHSLHAEFLQLGIQRVPGHPALYVGDQVERVDSFDPVHPCKIQEKGVPVEIFGQQVPVVAGENGDPFLSCQVHDPLHVLRTAGTNHHQARRLLAGPQKRARRSRAGRNMLCTDKGTQVIEHGFHPCLTAFQRGFHHPSPFGYQPQGATGVRPTHLTKPGGSRDFVKCVGLTPLFPF